MSKLTFRIALALVIGLVVIAGAYASVQAMSSTAQQESKGMYVLGGSLTRPFQQSSAVDKVDRPQFDVHKDPYSKGHGGCDMDYMDPSDF